MAKRGGGFIGQDGINAPDPATGVAGTSGDGQVEVSFTAPSDVGGAAITGYSVQSSNGDGTIPSSLSAASYDNLSFSVNAYQPGITGIFFKPDGTKLYTCGFSNDTVREYDLSTAWDISSAAYNQSFSISGQEGSSRQVFFKPDGTSMYIIGVISDTVYQYTLSTAWDISSASYASKSFSVASQDTAPAGLSFKSDGTKMYVSGSSSGNNVYQYSLSTAWDVSTASYDSVSFPPSGVTSGYLRGVWFSSDGSYMYLVDASGIEIFKAEMSTAWDISTSSMVDGSLDVSSEDLTIYNVFGSTDGTKMYLAGSSNDKIFQYTTNLNGYPTSSPVTVTGLTNGTSYTFNVWAINPFGWSSPSDASGGVTPIQLIPRALFSGSRTGPSNSIGYVEIETTGNTTDFGDLLQATYYQSGCASSTRGIFSGGITDGSRIEYVTIMSTGNSTDFGDLINTSVAGASCSNSTRGVIAEGSLDIQYITIATTGNAIDFGDRTVNVYAFTGCASPTRGLFAGGESSTNVIDYITIASTGNAINFGNLTQSRSQLGGVSSDVRGVFGGGASGVTARNTIDYVTIASTGNATDFGDLTVSRYGLAAAGSNTRGIFGAGASSGRTLDYVTIATTGNATDFGDNNTPAANHRDEAACSNSHGGLQ